MFEDLQKALQAGLALRAKALKSLIKEAFRASKGEKDFFC